MYKKIFFGLILLFLVSVTFAQQIYFEDQNFVKSTNLLMVEKEIDLLRARISLANESGLKVTRFNDEFYIIRQIYQNNLASEKSNIYANYNTLFEKIESLNVLIDLAYNVQDELIVLKQFLDTASLEIDITDAMKVYSLAEQEFNDERYELVTPKIDQTYEKVNELQSLSAKTSAIYDATRKNVIGFLEENWQILLVVIFVPLFLFLLFRKKMKCYFVCAKIKANEYEVDVLKNEMKSTQEKYFIHGSLPEGEYAIKIKLYSEKIRLIKKNNALLVKELRELNCKKCKGLKTPN